MLSLPKANAKEKPQTNTEPRNLLRVGISKQSRHAISVKGNTDTSKPNNDK